MGISKKIKVDSKRPPPPNSRIYQPTEDVKTPPPGHETCNGCGATLKVIKCEYCGRLSLDNQKI